MDYYATLGLPRPSSAQTGYEAKDIRQAYRRRALALHPDKNAEDQHAPDKFNRLTIAFEFLICDKKRAEYDSQLAPPQVVVHRRVLPFDQEKRRLAQELERREREARLSREHNEARRGQDEDFLRKKFKSVPKKDSNPSASKDVFAAHEQERTHSLAHLHETREKLHRRQSGDQATASAHHMFILRIHWAEPHRGGDFDTEAGLRRLLQPHGPFRLANCDLDRGSAQVNFFDPNKALTAAMAFSTFDPADSGTGWRGGAFTGVRLVRKLRSGLTRRSKIPDDVIDEDEMDRLLNERGDREPITIPDNSESNLSGSSSGNSVISRLFPRKGPETSVPNLQVAQRPILSGPLPRTTPLITSVEDEDLVNLAAIEMKTMSLLRAAIDKRKRVLTDEE